MFDTVDPPRTLSRLRTIKVPLWVPSVLLVALALAVIAYPLATRNAERERKALVLKVTEHAAAEHATLNRQAEAALGRASDQTHRLFGVALAWAIRSAWMRDNFDQLEQYVAELVKHERLQLVVLADADGRIVLSSDLNLKGSGFARHFPETLLGDATVTVHDAGGRTRRMTIPIQGLNSRLGTALVVYVAPALAAP